MLSKVISISVCIANITTKTIWHIVYGKFEVHLRKYLLRVPGGAL